jgi:hypothetical protein
VLQPAWNPITGELHFISDNATEASNRMWNLFKVEGSGDEEVDDSWCSKVSSKEVAGSLL